MPSARDIVRLSTLIAAGLAAASQANAQSITYFTPNDLVISTVSGTVLDQASAITLQQFNLGAGGTTATAAGSLVLPQTASGANAAISGEYGSASEGFLQQSANGQYLTIMGYGVNANTFNTASLSTYGATALGQTTSLTGQSVTTVPRVVGLIGTTGNVDTTTALTGVFNLNNPRSAATVDGTSFYVSGQGVTGDGTGGVFYTTKGATTATAINNNTTTPSGTPNGTLSPLLATDTRAVEIVKIGGNNQLQVSRDYGASGTPNDTTDIRALTSPLGGLPTSSTGLVANRLVADTLSSKGNYGSINLTAGTANGVNNARIGSFVYLSPEAFYYANDSTLYIADSGAPKNGSANAAGLGAGGLQKWINSAVDGSGTWSLAYDLVNGLNLVNNATASTPTAPGVTGLFGLTGEVINGQVELFATSYGLNELSSSYLYEITDTLSNTTIAQASSEQFAQLYAAPAGTSIRGVAFTPAPEPASLALFAVGLCGVALVRHRRSR